MFCSKCGAENTESASSCEQCGAALVGDTGSSQESFDHETDTDFVREITSPLYSVKIWIKRLAVVLILSGVAAIWATLTIDLPPIKRSTRRVSFPIIIDEGELHEAETIQ